MSENKNEIPGVSPVSIRMDLLRFKDEILKEMKNYNKLVESKYIKSEGLVQETIAKFELKLNNFSENIAGLSNLIVTDKSIREKVESLNQFKEEFQDVLFKRRAKFSEFEKNFKTEIERINKVLTDTVIYPSLIGKASKFKSFHEFMDYVVQEIAQLDLFKDKSGLDLGPFKKKIDNSIESFQKQINTFTTKDYVDKMIKYSEDSIKAALKIYDDRLQDTRVENSHYSFGLLKKAEDLEKQMEILKRMEKNINRKLESQKSNDLAIGCTKEFEYIRKRLNKINNVIKELLSYHPDSKKKFFQDFEKKPTEVFSGVKAYIKGNINASELTSMKKFNFERSKTKNLDKILVTPKISSFPSSDKKNNNEYMKRNSNNYDEEKLGFKNSFGNSNRLNVINEIIATNTFLTQNNVNDRAPNIKFGSRDSLNNGNEFPDKKSIINHNIKTVKFVKKNTANYGNMLNFDSLVINNAKKNNLISEDNKERKNSFVNDDNDDLPDSLKNEKIDEPEVKKSCLKKTNKKEPPTTHQSSRNIHNNNIIKEEDETVFSEHSSNNIQKIVNNNHVKPNNKRSSLEMPNKNNNIISSEKQIENKNKIMPLDKPIENKVENSNRDKDKNVVKNTNNNNLIIKNEPKNKINITPNKNINNDKIGSNSFKTIKMINSDYRAPNNNNNFTTNIYANINTNINTNLNTNTYTNIPNITLNKTNNNGFYNDFNNNHNYYGHNTFSPYLETNRMVTIMDKERKIGKSMRIYENQKKVSSYPKDKKIGGGYSYTSMLNNNKIKMKSITLSPNKNGNKNGNKIDLYSQLKIIAYPKINKTFSNFHKVNAETSSSLFFPNNTLESRDITYFGKNLNQRKNKILYPTNKAKKFLLINPNNISHNSRIKNKNHTVGKVNEIRKIKS